MPSSHSETLYAALDGASIPHLPEELDQLGCQAECLYLGELDPAIRAVAPWLLRLSGLGEFEKAQQWFLSGAEKAPWGLLLRSDAPYTVVRRHLRSLNLIRIQGEDTFLFRWYDPRILPPFLNILDQEQRSAVFGPVESFGIVEPNGRVTELLRPSC